MTEQMHFRDAIAGLVPYEPGKPAEELARERGLDHVIKLASNEGPWGPVAAAERVIRDGVSMLNRYPDGGCVLLREALAERHGVQPSEVIVGHGADSIINNLSLAMLDPGDEVVCGWPSFPSYVLDARKMGATAVMVPLDDEYRYDLDAMLTRVTGRTRIAYLCNPNNPTGTMRSRGDVAAFLDALPAHVLPVLDEAYFEYVQDADYPDGVADFFAQGRQVMVLRTFSKIHGLAGLRVGYAIAPAAVVTAVEKVRNAFDVTSLAQAAAMASLDAADEIAARASSNAKGLEHLSSVLRSQGIEPVCSVANFLCAPLDVDGREIYERLLGHGIIVRPLAPFGLANAVRITVGTPDENEAAARALAAVLPSPA